MHKELPPLPTRSDEPSREVIGAVHSSAPPPLSHGLFINQQGLRPVWRVVLFLVIWRALYWVIGAALYYTRIHGLWRGMFAEAGLLATVAVATIIMAAIEQRAPGDYGLPLRETFGRNFWLGAIWGMAALSFLLALMHGIGVFDFGILALHGIRILKFAVFWGAMFLLVALYEELLSRGYVLFTMTQSIGFWPSALLFSIGFGLLHVDNPGESKVGIAAAAAIGLFLCLTVRRTGTLWFAVGFHAAWDWGETYFYSVPDSGQVFPGHLLNSSFHGPQWLSGGSVGPEGSVLVFLVVAITWIVFDRVYPRANYPLPSEPKASTFSGV
jgi:membrane protease YdiL (CAAX protease family)